MPADWYYAKDGERFGPFEAQQIKEFAAQGVLRPTDSVTRKGMPQWMPAHTVKGLFAESPPAVPQSPPAASEVTLYQDDDVVVTTQRVVLGDTVIPLGDIISAQVKFGTHRLVLYFGWFFRIGAYAYALLGPLTFIAIVVGDFIRGSSTDNLLQYLIGPPLASGGAWVISSLLFADYDRKSVWRLIIQTRDETLQVLGAKEKSVNAAVADAINDAMRCQSAS